ncbi:FAD-linked oxidoreductase [Stemphylium lycopersici]|nr:FAD-linked oxidoreductase [Stemphylium lycopersici]
MTGKTLCVLGCGTSLNSLTSLQIYRPILIPTPTGNLGTPILRSLLNAPNNANELPLTSYIACVHSASSETRLNTLFAEPIKSGKLSVSRGNNASAIARSDVIILAVDPAQVEATLAEDGVREAFLQEGEGKLAISVIAGLSRTHLSSLILGEKNEVMEKSGSKKAPHVLRTLPNVCAQVSQSLTALEAPGPDFPNSHLRTAEAIFSTIGKPLHISPRHMSATTAVAGSTPAFWAVITDALIDAAVAVGLPRPLAQAQIYQSMRGSAEMLQSGLQPGELRDMGTSPEGCTIAGVMVLEEMGVRGALGRALRESVTVARAMGGEGEDKGHVNDTRRV